MTEHPTNKSDDKEFHAWLKLLDAEAHRRGHDTASLSQDTGIDCWRPYFDDGQSPEEALTEDASYD